MKSRDPYLHINKKTVIMTIAAIGLVLSGAALASYMANQPEQTAAVEPVKPAPKKVAQRPAAPRQQPQQMAQAQPQCDDGNIVGTVVGGVGGGVLGNQIGDGKGKTVATIAGTMGGAYLGNQYIPTRGALCK